MTCYGYGKIVRLLHIIYVFVCFLKITWIFGSNESTNRRSERTSQEFDQLSTPTKKHPHPQHRPTLPCYASPLAVASRFDAKLADLTGRPWPNISCPKALRVLPYCQWRAWAHNVPISKLCDSLVLKITWMIWVNLSTLRSWNWKNAKVWNLCWFWMFQFHHHQTTHCFQPMSCSSQRWQS